MHDVHKDHAEPCTEKHNPFNIILQFFEVLLPQLDRLVNFKHKEENEEYEKTELTDDEAIMKFGHELFGQSDSVFLAIVLIPSL